MTLEESSTSATWTTRRSSPGRSTWTRTSFTSSPKLQPFSDSDSSSSDGNSVVAELTTGAEAQALVPTRWDEPSK